ncbi:CCA tRNA nucleotidyltransferase [Rossellomorea sp. SC111]|uniref:CCA tRNA nucleotidyltransferase n=1 Tax=Rossellomorea sp. SC111 TaxID=2968985 RepID=UPI00215A57BD|nr:CCA tRNA nucleotidyltransferase [Rossellomorea sp. SC111]MCR8846919.1 CCA tRNA nucleotidyltransferase [Rossellomorea sp. SC111]
MLPTIFQQAVPVLKKLEKAGFEAYFVGGSVRDHLLGRTINDVDIATSAYPEEVKAVFHRTIDIGIEHGTVLVLEEGREYEITTFRTESSYTDYRRPDKVEFIRSLVGDLKRRDFTMNSMAMNGDGLIIDPYHGKEDIHNRLIRTVGSPEMRFTEDALRMMRAVRFVSQLGFGLESSTLTNLREHSRLLEHIAVERKTMEFEKILAGQWKQEGLNLLVGTNLYKELPFLSGYGAELKALADLPCLDTLNKDQAWLILLTYIGEVDVQGFLKGWRLPVKMIRGRSKELDILKERKSGWTKPLLYRAGLEAALNVEKVYGCLEPSSDFSLERVMEQYQKLAILSRQELDVTGTDLMEWAGQKGGPWVKERLLEIESAIINETIPNDKEEIRRWLATCNRL